MAVVFPRKLIVLEHPRTGSSAVRAALKSIGGRTRGRHTLVKPTQGEMVAATVRNPYDIVVSWWLNTKGKWHTLKFSDFVSDYIGNSLFTRGGKLFYFMDHVTMMMRYETLERDLTNVLKLVQLPPVSLKHTNITENKLPYTSYYTPAIQEAVAQRWGDEIEGFGYGFED